MGREAMSNIDGLIREARGKGAEDLVDCMVFVREIAYAAEVRRTLRSLLSPEHAPALTIVEAGLEHDEQKVSFKCVAAVPEAKGASVTTNTLPGVGKAAHGKFLYTSGKNGALATNGTDALLALKPALKSIGSNLSKVVSCVFFLKNNNQVYSLFSGFF